MKNDKRVEIIEKAIEIFAEKGFHATTVQEIASALNISKGGFYTYFPSKDELIIEIFHYYSAKLKESMEEVSEELPPKERMKEQMKVQFENFISHKPFMQMHFREQNASVIKGIKLFIRKNYHEMSKWYENHFEKIYGSEITPVLGDAITLCEGMKQSFMRAFMISGQPIDLDTFSTYLMERFDDTIQGLLKSKLAPIINKQKIDNIIKPMDEDESKTELATQILNKMRNSLEVDSIKETTKKELLGVIDFILQEIKKDKPQKMIIQGMLANLRGIKEIEKERERFANIMSVQLL